ncbi:hemagglutinin repeat-containing protein [Escherichia coli]|nr:hemagglutinin repeat-containing protein [Escherichia coli]
MHQPPVRFTYRLLSYLISTIIAGQPLLPAVGAVITPQNGAGMDKAANGVPVVNIATPNGAGISHNRFTDYNVGKEGLILNNATGKLNPTQLGGLIQNNPNLKAGGEAKGIINEVTGGNRSLLQGYTEVAGKAANVMVANPYGITCDGCGFINTPHATLTTGRPVMNADGSLQALEVTEGSITINGAGLDGTRSDAVSIIARATEVNAALHAKDLTVTAGANRVTADGRVSALKGEGDVPKVAVDTGALGGMYARRIHLTSTESGVGVNLGNLYAREGDIILNSAGKLVLKNSLAGGNTTVTGTDVSLSGDNKAGGNLSVTGTTGLTLNQSRLVTDKNLVLSSSGQIVQNGGDSVVVDPGHDRRTVDEKFEQKKSGLTVALSGTVGSAINNAATMVREAKETSDSRLAVLKGTQAVLSGVQAGVNHGLQQQSADPNNGIGVSISLNHQQSKSETKYQHDIVSGSTLSAGNNVSVTATGKNKDHNNSGDILITGSQIKSGNDTSLNAQNDILLAAAADTRQTTGKNSSKGGGVGVSFGGGTNGGGLSIFASINGSKGSEKGNGTTWTETTLDAGKNVSLTSGRDTTLSGAQVSGEKVTADVGNNLTISSLQDSDRYDSRQNSVAAGGSFTFGSMSGSGYASISQDKIKSNYDSVREQSGIYAGKDGFDVTVGNHTQLNGAVIASTATDDKNSLSTGTLGWSDIHNQADYKASHTGISSSGGSGMSASQMVASNAIAGAANALTGMSGSSGHAEGTTSSAISGGNLIIRDKESQKQNIAGLSRDPENANGSIAPIFDREKEQKRLQEAQVISQISGQMSNIVMTYGETEAMKAARKEHPGMSDAQLRETPEYREVMKGYGTGSTPQMVVQAITGVLGGLNAGNPGQVLAGGLNPAVAQLIKQSTGDNREANLMAHAVWGALAAQLGGNNAASGAAGAFSGELAARYIIDNYYGGRTDSLSEQERQQISMLATIASGIAGGLASNSTSAAGTGAQAGRNSVENNYLSVSEKTELEIAKQTLKNSKDPAEREKAQQKYDALLEKDISSDKAVIAACSNGQAASVACAGERLRVIAAKGGYETGNYNNQVSDMYPDAYGQIVNLLNITSVDAQNQQQVKDAMVNYAMTQFGVDKATAESYVETYDGMKTVAASMTPVIGAAAANKISVLGQGIVKESVSKNPNSSSAITDAEAGGYSYYDKFKNANGGWDWPKNLGFEGDPIKTIIPVGTRLDRYGEPTGSFLAPKGTPYEQRALAPGTKAEKYYEYEVIKPLPAIQGKIAPAFGEPGGGIQILPNMQERVNVEWLLKNGYIREVR